MVNKMMPPIVVALIVTLLVVLSGSAASVFPEGPVRVFDATPRLTELNAAVHQHIAFDLRSGPRVAEKLVLVLMDVTKRQVGIETHLAVVRLEQASEPRVVMEWGDRYYDPVLAAVYTPGELSSVIRSVSFQTAFARAGVN